MFFLLNGSQQFFFPRGYLILRKKDKYYLDILNSVSFALTHTMKEQSKLNMHFLLHMQSLFMLFNRPGVVGAVLQTPSSLIN